MSRKFVVAESDIEGVRAAGDTAVEKRLWDRSKGSGVLVQRVLRFAPGRSHARTDEQRDDLLYVVSGHGTLALEGSEHALEPEDGVFVLAGETWQIDNPGPDELLVVSVTAPAGGTNGNRRVVVRFAEQPELRADAKRSFRYLVNESAGCLAATQFLGIVQPCRAPDHSHSYDELGYIVDGNGWAHLGGQSIPLRPGSSFHLPPEQVHCIENTGPGIMRILGVFHPAGDPATRTYDEAASTAEGGSST